MSQTDSKNLNLNATGFTPLTTVIITGLVDEIVDPAGGQHEIPIWNGKQSADPTPKLLGLVSAPLRDDEHLNVYRDGVYIGRGDVSGLQWAYQDADVAAGNHVYTARVESLKGALGLQSADFSITSTTGSVGLDKLKLMVTDDFLIFDIRALPQSPEDDRLITIDIEETIRQYEKMGLHVTNHSERDGFISFEVDWKQFAISHPAVGFELFATSQYDSVYGSWKGQVYFHAPWFAEVIPITGKWLELDYAGGVPIPDPKSAVTIEIAGIFDNLTSPNGDAYQALVPDGGLTASSAHIISGSVFSERSLWGTLYIYRDGVMKTTINFDHNVREGTSTGWSFEDTAVPPGPHTYVIQWGDSAGGGMSVSYDIVNAGPTISTTATIACLVDEFTDPGGTRHSIMVQNGGVSQDTHPHLIGSLSATLSDGELLAIYRDRIFVGYAEVDGDDWTFRDPDFIRRSDHIYTVRVQGSEGTEGAMSDGFYFTKAGGLETTSFEMLVTENYLIVDARSFLGPDDEDAIPFDLRESIKGIEAIGLHVKSYTEDSGRFCFEVDWTTYALSHPNDSIKFVWHFFSTFKDGEHFDLYDHLGAPTFATLLNNIGNRVSVEWIDVGLEAQVQRDPPSTQITGLFDDLTHHDGVPYQSHVPDGAASDQTTITVAGTFNRTFLIGGDGDLAIYRDGEKVGSTAAGYRFPTVSGDSWSFQDINVPPGPHVYTARVERLYGVQGEWSSSYSFVETGIASDPDISTARLMLTDGALTLDVHGLQYKNVDVSAANTELHAELIVANQSVASLALQAYDIGFASFDADWTTLAAMYPDASLRITVQPKPDGEPSIIDQHSLKSLIGQENRWVTMTSDGEHAAFFEESDRGIHIHGGADLNMIAIAGEHHLIDLTSLSGKTVGSTVMNINTIDLGGQHNTLKISMIDVLNLGEPDFFRIDGKQQMMVIGRSGDSIELRNTLVAGITDGEWERQGSTQIKGAAYDVYEHSTAHVELLVQSQIQLTMI